LIPTLNEAENVDCLLERVLAAADSLDLDFEVLVVDGGSTDGTQAKVREWSRKGRVRLVESDAGGGLAGDILFAARSARADVVVVLDADLSHPPESLPNLLRPVLDGSHDIVLGSRYVRGGATPGWPWHRRLASRAATLLSWPFVSARDPMSGFFAVRREHLTALGQEACGFKIALEILARGAELLRVMEVPIVFRDRLYGLSKLGWREAGRYLRQLAALAGGAVSAGSALRFGLVGLSGLVVDLLVFTVLLATGAGLFAAHSVSFAVATLANYTLNARWSFARTARLSKSPEWLRYLRFLCIGLLAYFLRGAILTSLVEAHAWAPRIAILAAIAAATAVNFIGTAFFVFPEVGRRVTESQRWRVISICLVLYLLALRLAYAGLIDLIPEEAYYWNYSRHLDIGYLDHPPMVSWLIWLGSLVGPYGEGAVRLPAIVSWFVLAAFLSGLARNLFDKTTAFLTLALSASLPIYFGVGLFMTPDAPLYASWAGCLFFLERALIGDRRRVWYGAGACLGLGLLSKYTALLLAPAAIAFVLLDHDSRRWLRRREPYFAALLALALFTPVIVWNAGNEWASFAFQGTRRLAKEAQFGLHTLVLSGLLLLTPLGLLGALRTLVARRSPLDAQLQDTDPDGRRKLFAMCFTLLPLGVFVLFSLFHVPKFNWTGPVWLAALPLLAWEIGRRRPAVQGTLDGFTSKIVRS
jgi:dolichol-phosphate mannosyltransferase